MLSLKLPADESTTPEVASTALLLDSNVIIIPAAVVVAIVELSPLVLVPPITQSRLAPVEEFVAAPLFAIEILTSRS